ncbi:Na+/H+ antiporter subunit E [Macrococcus armenti]|uniref:Na+/H+ antiporter subunit E n=1 Tax=Macrococcus armenti TaxID=2875764 RepID=UPI001CCBC5CE|nr:Na+/H+ antiporter subunit E [Macrococcus armenti]UBH09250.1 Na+/H+ antiporter subunit E [Macrococcus armenti]UBH11546.1 Na+/H+ antiporter subunit E [Macrococcus armenti]UBH16012.1 Na+/H+ antiporter subunit E [Macrococcus armenti]UBH18373.1 Na+/H+ antiporter subunit E [Macrococcus armenti]UBH20639.1 Na+/H+ antiporter subunit E [Macrococcus armenti]
MAIQLIIHIGLMIMWVIMTGSASLGNLILGYLFGLCAIYVMRPFLPGGFYLIPFLKVLRLFTIFIIELFKANIGVLKIVMAPKINIKPAFFTYETDLRKDWEISLLSLLITLTPGTVVVAVSDDKSKLYIHSIDFSDIESECASIKHSFEKAIKEIGIQ